MFIPLTLLILYIKKKGQINLIIDYATILFILFIFCCGTGHLMGFVIFYWPLMWLDVSVKILTALVSALTVIYLWSALPKILALKTPSDYLETSKQVQLLIDGVKDDSIVMLNPEGKIMTWNANSEKMKGYKESEVIGKHFSIFYLKEEQEKASNELKEAVETGRFEEEGQRVRKNGEAFPAHVIVLPIYDETGILRGFSKTTRDITEAVKIKEQMKMRQEMHQNILDSAISAYVQINNKGIITFWNRSAEVVFGWTKQEAIGKPVTMIIPPEHRPAHLVGLEDYLKSGKSKILNRLVELSALHKRGYQFPIEISVTSTNLGDEVFFSAFIKNITDGKNAAKQLEEYAKSLESVNQELAHFAYIASHDLKAPLRGIHHLSQWIVEELGQTTLTDKAKNYISLLQQRVQKMNLLIDGILQYSRVGRHNTDKENVDLNIVVNETIESLDKKQFTINIKDPLPTIYINAISITQVFNNIIGNAIKHHTREDGKIDISCKRLGDHWIFSIKDDGPGIPKNLQPKLFKLFNTLSDKPDSTGIGLAICLKIIEVCGGKIWLESEEGKGCNFKFTLPTK